MPDEEIDGVPIWYEEHGDPTGPPLVALHGGIVTYHGSFGDVLPWLTEGRRVIGVEVQGHGHTPDTGRAISIERFADDVAELIDGVAGGGPVDVWGFSLGARSRAGGWARVATHRIIHQSSRWPGTGRTDAGR
jgi:pimeloyl-ACP methyl ester carboxylesterase